MNAYLIRFPQDKNGKTRIGVAMAASKEDVFWMIDGEYDDPENLEIASAPEGFVLFNALIENEGSAEEPFNRYYLDSLDTIEWSYLNALAPESKKWKSIITE